MGSTTGLRTYDGTLSNNAAYWGTTFVWNTTTARNPTDTISQVASQPLYVIDKMPNVGTTEIYRVTARGVGRDSNAVVILQAAYSFTP